MNCLLFQLKFNTPVHFGSPDSALSLYSSEVSFRADTLFSALCHTAAQLYGAEGAQRLIELAKSGKLILSDSMPWQGDTLYLPKPYCTARIKKEQPADQRKKLKKLAWIPVDRFDEYCRAMQTGELFSCDVPVLGHAEEVIKAAVPELEDAKPYPVGIYRFSENTGLYFLMECDPEHQVWLRELIAALGCTGIGGKISIGYGKYVVVDTVDLEKSPSIRHSWILTARNRIGGKQLLLTTSLPGEKELETALEGASYQMVRRAGFVSTNAGASGKKLTQHFLDAGSVLCVRFEGDVYPVADMETHTAYRYSKPMFLGVEL